LVDLVRWRAMLDETKRSKDERRNVWDGKWERLLPTLWAVKKYFASN